MCLGLFQRKTVQKPSEFTSGDLLNFVCALRPAETASLQTLIVEPESILVPLQNLNFAFVFAAKNEHGPAEWIQLKVLFHHARKSVNCLSHIRCAASQINNVGSADLYHGVCTAEMTDRKVTASNPTGTSTTISRICMSRFPLAGLDCSAFFSKTAGTFTHVGEAAVPESLLVSAAHP